MFDNRKWFPNCGPQLIKMGIPVFKYFGDLTPQEMLHLFLHFYNTPDYGESTFKTMSNAYRHLIDEGEDEETVRLVDEHTDD